MNASESSRDRLDTWLHRSKILLRCPNLRKLLALHREVSDHLHALFIHVSRDGEGVVVASELAGHGEPYNAKKGYFHSYGKGKQVNDNQGEFTAIFDGTHGWFWRNRSNSDVTISLKATGDYLSVKQ